MAEDRLNEFKEHMKVVFSKIPQNLTEEEMKDRSERCMSMSEHFRSSGEVWKAKEYELLSLKYKKMISEKNNPKPLIEDKKIVIEEVSTPLMPQQKKSTFSNFFLKFFKKK